MSRELPEPQRGETPWFSRYPGRNCNLAPLGLSDSKTNHPRAGALGCRISPRWGCRVGTHEELASGPRRAGHRQDVGRGGCRILHYAKASVVKAPTEPGPDRMLVAVEAMIGYYPSLGEEPLAPPRPTSCRCPARRARYCQYTAPCSAKSPHHRCEVG